MSRHRVVGRDFDIRNRLELNLNLICGLIRVSGFYLRRDGAARGNHAAIRHCGHLAGRIDSDCPTFRYGGRVDLVLVRVNCFVSLDNRLETNLGGEVVVQSALGKIRTYQIGYLGMVRVNDYQQFNLISRAVRVLYFNLRTGEGTWIWVFRGGYSDVVVLIHLNRPTLVDIVLI